MPMRSKENIIVVSHTMLYGAPHALRDYILQKLPNILLFISLPFFDQRIASSSRYKNGKLTNEVCITRFKSTNILDYCIDALQIVWWVSRQKEKFSFYIGINPLNCMVGLFFRKIGKVKKIIFYAIDFTPKRFANSFLNSLYHKMEAYCVIHSDEVWNVSPKIAEGREKFLNISSKKYPQKVVPIGVWYGKIRKIPFSKIKKHQIVFLGHLLKKQGVQMVLSAIPDIIKYIPKLKFIIIGGGEYEKDLKELTEKLHIGGYVEFKGWIKDRNTIDAILGVSALAVAVYEPEEDRLYNFTYYADSTKIKDYLAHGLPIVLTNVPYNAHELEKMKCGIVVAYQREKISQAIISLLRDPEKLKIYQHHAFSYVKRFDWNNIFSKAYG